MTNTSNHNKIVRGKHAVELARAERRNTMLDEAIHRSSNKDEGEELPIEEVVQRMAEYAITVASAIDVKPYREITGFEITKHRNLQKIMEAVFTHLFCKYKVPNHLASV